MTARLTVFYAIDPWRLLAELPMGIVRALSEMLPQLQAEQSLEATDQIAVGVNKAFAEGATKPAIERWNEALGAGARAVRRLRATPQQLAAIGIGFTKVPKVSHAR